MSIQISEVDGLDYLPYGGDIQQLCREISHCNRRRNEGLLFGSSIVDVVVMGYR